MCEEVRETEQLREPRFYPNEVTIPFKAGGNAEKTLQSIDDTLKRIEIILLGLKNQFSVLEGQVSSQQK